MPEAPVLVGIAGWSYPDWEDVVYPRGERNKLAYVSRYLDCVEINTSFYRPVAPRYAEKWVRDVSQNERFQFTAKLWSRFTHQTGEPYTDNDVKTCKAGLGPLKDAGKLAGLLIQFPFFFRDSPESRDLLKRIADDFAEYQRVLEVRDISWSDPEALEFITDLGMNVACLDMPLSKRSFKEEALTTGDMGYLRLHGRNREAWFSKDAGRDERYNYLYSDAEMDQVYRRIEKLREVARLVVVIWNNHFRGKATVNAFQTLHRLLAGREPSGQTSGKVNVPALLRRHYPQLQSISRSTGGPDRRGGLLFER